jgi:hypothetical protein
VIGPTIYELIINLKIAKELGITIPPSIMVRADEAIERNGKSVAGNAQAYSLRSATQTPPAAGG